MVTRARILLVHSEPDRVATLRSALGDDLETLGVSCPEEAWEKLSHGVKLVVAEEKVGVRFLEELSRRAPGTPRAILLNGGNRIPWVDAAADGHVFFGISEHAPDAAARLRAIVLAQAETRVLQGCTVSADPDGRGALLTGPLLRLTSEILVFRIEPGDTLEAFLPGRELQRVVVERGREVVLDCAAAIRSLRPDSTGGYEVEVVLSSPPAPPQPEEVVRDGLQRASLIGEALRRGLLTMRRPDGVHPPVKVRGRVDAATDLLLLHAADGYAAGTGVSFSFDAGGAHYEFFAALADPPAPTEDFTLAVNLPPELRGRRRRRPRVALEGTAELTAALDRKPLRRKLLDIEMEGMGLLADAGDLLPVGTRVTGVEVKLQDGTALRASGRIASRSPLAGPSGTMAVRCGLQFDPLHLEHQSALAAAILKQTHAGLELARGLTFDALWSFLRECGFLYPEKEQKLLPALPEIMRTIGALLARGDGPLRTLVFRSNGLLQGHLSIIRAYRRTWSAQHLAVRKDGAGRLDAAKALTVGQLDYLEQLPDAEWIRSWYRPQNRFPARTFGRFARMQHDPSRNDLRTYAYLTAPSACVSTPATPGVEVTPASAADWAEIRRHLVQFGHSATLAAEDLCRAPELFELDDDYALLGLTRRREALVARRAGRLLGYALVEISSLGLNFSELTNAFRVHLVERDPAATTALACAGRERYAMLGRPLAIGLAESPDLDAWAAAGFTKGKEYCCWTFHRSLLRRCAEYMTRLYEHLPAAGAPRMA